MITKLNDVYSRVARRLTEWENYENDQDFKNALIVKRFIFFVLDSYMPLFYIAFYEMNLLFLKRELMGLFVSDEIRRVTLESILPLITQREEVWGMINMAGDD